MPFEIKYINALNEPPGKNSDSSGKVFKMANELIRSMGIFSESINYLISATSCPDSLSPSLSQNLCSANPKLLNNTHCFDLVQGCTGGVSAFILGSKLAETKGVSVLVVQSDAAQKATSDKRSYYSIFGNGAFTALLVNKSTGSCLLYSKSYQVPGLEEIVKIRLGHDADEIIKDQKKVSEDPRYFLGLELDNSMAIKLLKSSKTFYLLFVKESCEPDVLILHQVNPRIIGFLKLFLNDFKGEFIDVSAEIGNCGAATTGIAYYKTQDRLKGKKVLICSFGTGGVITAGLWQF